MAQRYNKTAAALLFFCIAVLPALFTVWVFHTESLAKAQPIPIKQDPLEKEDERGKP